MFTQKLRTPPQPSSHVRPDTYRREPRPSTPSLPADDRAQTYEGNRGKKKGGKRRKKNEKTGLLISSSS
jgi:hypothetical protein